MVLPWLTIFIILSSGCKEHPTSCVFAFAVADMNFVRYFDE